MKVEPHIFNIQIFLLLDITIIYKLIFINMRIKIVRLFCSGWCVSVDWVLACEPKGCWFNSQSEHMPGLWARSPAEDVQKKTDQCISRTSMFLSLSFSIPSLVSKKKKITKILILNSKVFYHYMLSQSQSREVQNLPETVCSRIVRNV